jgi:nicotinamidase-related amidase
VTQALPAGAVNAAPAGSGLPRVVAATSPYPWPYDGGLAENRMVLLISGAQRHWARRTTGAAQAVEHLIALSGAVRRAGGVVVGIRHVSAGPPHSQRPGLPHRSSQDASMVLPLGAFDEVIDAAGLDGFFGSSLDAHLLGSGRDQLFVAGLSMEGPVHSTMRSANDRGLECLLVADACSYDTPQTRHAAVSSVEMSGGIFGAVGTTANVIDALTTLHD